ncbi:MAG TPA: RluA family pseudouridine synthase, partial [Steroidobacteraceae bacterium]|nr:RluA family pseudouridine synthase [Steroidobacteraceae bacterium]
MKRRTLTAPRDGTLEELLEAPPEVISRGGAYVDGRRCRDPKARVKKGALLVAVLEDSGRPPPTNASEPLRVLFEDDDVIAVDKPAGLLTQPGPGGGVSLLELVSQHLGREAGLVHRLDRETSGVVVFGKHKRATSMLAAAFRDGTAKKQYVAIVSAELPERGEIDLPLSRDPSRPGRWRATRKANGVPALTRYETKRSGAYTVVTLFPETGRTHQLRAHLTALGAPIVGDRLYGGASGARCLLHARSLTIAGRTIEAPLPP